MWILSGMRKIFYGISAALILISVFSIITRGLNQGIDFSGGRTYIVQFDQAVKTSDVAANLTGAFGEAPQVVTFGNDRQVRITTKYRINEPDVDDEVETALYDGLKGMIGSNVSKEEFLSKYRRQSETVGPTIATDMKNRAYWAVGISLILMFLYIFMRFKNWQYGLGALASLAHDTIIIVGLYSLTWGRLPFTMDIDQSFIAAILTIIGYSINDTVVVFDRLREFLPLHRKRPVNEVINMAMNDTLSRTMNTGMTSMLVLIAMIFFGGATSEGIPLRDAHRYYSRYLFFSFHCSTYYLRRNKKEGDKILNSGFTYQKRLSQKSSVDLCENSVISGKFLILVTQSATEKVQSNQKALLRF